ncbi:MAG: hypothetical protein WKG07_42305 [Hymenobacter sp.]
MPKRCEVAETIPVQLLPGSPGYGGDSPNALALDAAGTTLYVANGLDNAVAVVALGHAARAAAPEAGPASELRGFIPTEAYPGGLALSGRSLFVANLEGEGARVSTADIKEAGGELEPLTRAAPPAYNSHHQLATVSLIALPNAAQLARYSARVRQAKLAFRKELAGQLPRAEASRRCRCRRVWASPRCSGTCSTSSRKTGLTTRCSATCRRGGREVAVRVRRQRNAQPAPAGPRVFAA